MIRFLGLCFALISSGAMAQAAPKPTVVVADIKAPSAFTGAEGLTEELRTQVARHGRYLLITPEETAAVNAELQRQLSEGCDDPSCVTEIGSSLGARYVISGQVQQVGSVYSLSVKLIAIETVAAHRAASVRAQIASGLLDQIPNLVSELLGDRGQAGHSNAGASWGANASSEGDDLLRSTMASDDAFDQRQQARRDRMLEGAANRTPGASCTSLSEAPAVLTLLIVSMMRRRRSHAMNRK